jgi:cell division protein FtsI (penicillin-binding protein 3)
VKPREEPSFGGWRFSLLVAVLAAMALVLVWRLVSLQLLDTERGYRFLQDQGNARALRDEAIPVHRGIIRDRNGEPLAVSTPVQVLWANPQELVADDDDWAHLAQALNQRPDDLRQRMATVASRKFTYLRRQMNPADAQRVMDLKIPGINSRREYQRFYPAGNVAAHVVGFTDVDERGQEGIELAYDNWLTGVPGSKRVVKDRNGDLIRDVQELAPARPGRALDLSLDLRIQYLAHRELKKTVEATGAESGSIILLDVRTSEVLAMANFPSYNPNNRASAGSSALRNRAVTDLTEPGSTVKPFTIMTALESGKYKPETLIDTSPGYIRVGRKTFRDHHNLGVIPLTTVITKSSQVGTTKVALSLDPATIRTVFHRAGFGELVGTHFPGESVGKFPNPRRWDDVGRANFAFGYGLSVTPLQLSRAYLMLASGGRSRPVTLLKAGEPQEAEQVFPPEHVRELVAMMETVTQVGGTAKLAAIQGYRVAGKTGTVHRTGANGYEADHYQSLFAGFAPVSDPRIVCVVVVTDPRGGVYYGGAIAAPVFSAVVRGALRLLNVAPDNVPQTQAPMQVAGRNAPKAPA